jgi:hypothetical protein
MYMADDTFKRRSGVGVNTTVMFCTAGASLFAVPEYAASLEKVVKRRGIVTKEKVVKRRGIVTKFKHNLKEIKADSQEAIFDVTTDNGIEEVSIHYDMIHVTPPMSAPDFIKQSPLAGAGGWVDVDPATLQHTRYANVFSLGDASSLPTSKRQQRPASKPLSLCKLTLIDSSTTIDGSVRRLHLLSPDHRLQFGHYG